MNIFYNIRDKKLYTVTLVLPPKMTGGHYYEAVPFMWSTNSNENKLGPILEMDEKHFKKYMIQKYSWR